MPYYAIRSAVSPRNEEDGMMAHQQKGPFENAWAARCALVGMMSREASYFFRQDDPSWSEGILIKLEDIISGAEHVVTNDVVKWRISEFRSL